MKIENVGASDENARNLSRDSLFLLAKMTVDATGEAIQLRVRNLSAGGMMAEGDEKMQLERGDRFEVELRNIGIVAGKVAWRKGIRFGATFNEEIDPRNARKPIGEGTTRNSKVEKAAILRRIYLRQN